MVVAEGLRSAKEGLKTAIEKTCKIFSDPNEKPKEQTETVSSLWKALKELECEITNMEQDWEKVWELVSDQTDGT